MLQGGRVVPATAPGPTRYTVICIAEHLEALIRDRGTVVLGTVRPYREKGASHLRLLSRNPLARVADLASKLWALGLPCAPAARAESPVRIIPCLPTGVVSYLGHEVTEFPGPWPPHHMPALLSPRQAGTLSSLSGAWIFLLDTI